MGIHVGFGFGLGYGSKAGVSIPVAPVNTSPPIVTGVARVGMTLAVDNGVWTGEPGPSFTYQWYRGATLIAGATGETYLLVGADQSLLVHCDVTGTNPSGFATATSNSVGPIAAAFTAPANTVAPAVTGTARVGQTLSCSTGTWTGNPVPTFTYQWQRNTVNIASAQANTYLLVDADAGAIIRCVVTGTNSVSSVDANSNSTAAVTQTPANTALPTASGTAQVGATLTTTNGTWIGTPAPTFAYQWQRDGVDIGAATANTYLLVVGDLGTTVRCRVTATNSAGSASANSNGIGPISGADTGPINTVTPVVTGNIQVDEVLTSSSGTWTGNPTPTITYQWQRAAANVAGATNDTYLLTALDLGTLVRCVVTGSNTVGNVSAFSNSVGPIEAANTAPANTALPVVTGNTIVGQALSTTDGTWSGVPAPTFTYQWVADLVNIPGATQGAYLLTSSELGRVVHCVVTATNIAGVTPASSNTVGPITGTTTESLAEELLGARPDGIAFSFVDNSLVIRDSVTPANDFSGDVWDKFFLTRSSVATVENAAGLLVTAAINEIRYERATDGIPFGVEIEGASTNFMQNSANMSTSTYFLTTGAALFLNQVGPDGVASSATQLREDATLGDHVMLANVGITQVSAAAISISCWVKSIGGRNASLQLWDTGGIEGIGITFDFATETITQKLFGAGTVKFTRAEKWLNGWYRLCLSGAIIGTSIKSRIYAQAIAGVNSYQGDGNSGLAVYGMQIEKRDTITSYIPTVSATSVTRAADLCGYGPGAKDLDSGTITVYGYGKADYMGATAVAVLIHLQDVTLTQNIVTIEAYRASLPNSGRLLVSTLNVSQVNTQVAGAYNTEQPSKYAASVALNASAFIINDNLFGRDTTVTPPIVDRLRIGSSSTTTATLYGYMVEGMILPVASSDAELQALTLNPPV